jgi:hypothetical protein
MRLKPGFVADIFAPSMVQFGEVGTINTLIEGSQDLCAGERRKNSLRTRQGPGMEAIHTHANPGKNNRFHR